MEEMKGGSEGRRYSRKRTDSCHHLLDVLCHEELSTWTSLYKENMVAVKSPSLCITTGLVEVNYRDFA